MRHYLRNSENSQAMNDWLNRMKESLAEHKKMIAALESELELPVNQNRRGNHNLLSDRSGKLITGVRQFADYIHKSPATAQKILNKGVLQENSIAYRVGNSWTINIERLDQLISEDPQILRC